MTSTSKSFRYGVTAARCLMGLAFAFAGLNGLFMWFPPPPAETMPAGLVTLTTAFSSTYLGNLVAGTQLVVGLLLLANRFVPLALAVLAPVIVNIVAVHLFIDPKGLPIAFVVLALELFLAYAYRHTYRPMLAACVQPS
jgi:hypothetical protein